MHIRLYSLYIGVVTLLAKDFFDLVCTKIGVLTACLLLVVSCNAIEMLKLSLGCLASGKTCVLFINECD